MLGKSITDAERDASSPMRASSFPSARRLGLLAAATVGLLRDHSSDVLASKNPLQRVRVCLCKR